MPTPPTRGPTGSKRPNERGATWGLTVRPGRRGWSVGGEVLGLHAEMFSVNTLGLGEPVLGMLEASS